MTSEIDHERYRRDRQINDTAPYLFGRDYGRDLLTDINQLAHAAGTNCLIRDCLQRAHKEIARLGKALDAAYVARPQTDCTNGHVELKATSGGQGEP